MKKVLLLLMLAAFNTATFAANFYWVGDSTGTAVGGIGSNSRWHNPNSWAITSGGTVHPLTYPGPLDDVYFDNGWQWQYVFVGDTIAECNNMYISDGAIEIAYGGMSAGAPEIYISGNVTVTTSDPNSFGLYQPSLHFINPVSAYLSIPNDFMANNPSFTNAIYVESGCELILNTDYYARGFFSVFVTNGKLNLNGHRFRAAQFGGMPGSIIDVSNSTMYCAGIYNSVKLIATANANVYMDVVGYGDNILDIKTVAGTLYFDTISINNIPIVYGYEGLYCDDCNINNLLVDSSQISSYSVNGQIQNAQITASEVHCGMGGGFSYNMIINTLNFQPQGFPYTVPVNLSCGFGCNTTIVDTFLLGHLAGTFTRITSTDASFAVSSNVDLGDEYCFDSIAVENFINIGLPLHAGIHSTDLGGNTNVLFDSCGYINYLVWPGDANSDSIVNSLDMFVVGLYFGETGPARDSISNLWIGHNCADWSGTQFNGMNYKHADCNGDSIVDFADTVAVNVNYGLTRSGHTPISRSGPPVFVVPDAAVYLPGTLVTLDIWAGNTTTPLNNVYGLNYQVDVDPTAIEPGTLNINYTGSWLGTKNTNMITLQRYNAGVSDITQVRTDQTNISGMGKIAEITFIASNSISSFTNFPVLVNAAAAIDNSGADLLVGDMDTLFAVDPFLSITQIQQNFNVYAFPNPSTGTVYISSSAAITTIELYTMNGKRAHRLDNVNSNATVLNLNELSQGIYTIKIIGEHGVKTQKLTLLGN